MGVCSSDYGSSIKENDYSEASSDQLFSGFHWDIPSDKSVRIGNNSQLMIRIVGMGWNSNHCSWGHSYQTQIFSLLAKRVTQVVLAGILAFHVVIGKIGKTALSQEQHNV